MSPVPRPDRSPSSARPRERTAAPKVEHRSGHAVPMARASWNHVVLTSQLTALLHRALAGRKCTVLGSDLRVHVSSADFYTYPDVLVVNGDPTFVDEAEDTLLDPVVLVEVLSPETEDYDRGRKFSYYRAIPTLKEYLLVSPDLMAAELFRRNERDRWELYEARGKGAVVDLASLGIRLDLDALYAPLRV